MSDSDNNSEYSFKEDINNDILIREVQKRPALYDRTIKEFTDASAKKKIWQEICATVFKKWHMFSKSQQYSAEIELLKRWKNLRGCYAREIKIQQNPKKYRKRRKYIYYEKLKFLDPFLELNMRKSVQDSSQDTDDVQNERGNIKLEFGLEDNDNDDESRESNYIEERFIEVDTNMLESPMSSNNTQKRKRKVSEEYDPDTHFALSLVPMLSSLPMSRKINAQIEILQIFKKINGLQ